MNVFELNVEWYKLGIFSLITILVIIRTGGISFFFRLFMKIFNLSYDNHQMKRVESIAYDLQVFKAIEGVNVKHLNDARLIRSEINSGNIDKINFIFTSPFGCIGNKPITKFFIIRHALIILLFTAIAIYSSQIASTLKLGYYKETFKNESEYVSLTNVTTENELILVSKENCEFLLSGEHPFSLRIQSCSRLVNSYDNDGTNKIWLSKQIEKNDLVYRTLYWGSAFYFALAFILTIGLFNFQRMNREILKIKRILQ